MNGVAEKFVDAEKGLASLKRFSVDKEKCRKFNIQTIMAYGSAFQMLEEGDYVKLYVDGVLMMSDTPMERLEKMMELFKPTPLPKFPTQDEINASNLKFETAKHEMDVKRMRMQFKSDFIIACIDNGIVDDLCKRAENYARDIFDKR